MPRFKLKKLFLVLIIISILYYIYVLYTTISRASEEEDIERLINYQKNDPIHLLPEILVNLSIVFRTK